MPALTDNLPDQFTRAWRTRIVLSYVSYQDYDRVFRVVPRDSGNDTLIVPASALPWFALEWGPGTEAYAMLNVGAQTCADIVVTAWETRQKLIMRSLCLEDGTGDRVFYAPGLPDGCNHARVPHIELPEFMKDAHPGWTGWARVMVRADGTLDRITEFVPPRDPQEPFTDPALPHPYQGCNDSLVKAVAREFEEAGGVWAALAADSIDVRRVRREMEAVCREHNGNLAALIREATGYLELAMQAFHAQAYQAGRSSTAVTPYTSDEETSKYA